MPQADWLERQTSVSLNRLLPRLEKRYGSARARNAENWKAFVRRLEANWETLFQLLLQLYGNHYDFYYYLEELLASMARAWLERAPELKSLDTAREANSDWFLSNQMLGGVCYVDLFAGNLDGLRAKIPYLKELGLNYLHLMPLFKMPEQENDGGYAVSDYREVHPPLGTIEQLRELAAELRRSGISLVLDLVFNHTSDEHPWALAAKSGDPEAQSYYRTFPDRQMPEAYETHLREIFPNEHPGAFSFSPELGQWVWTTFHRYQWDLNYDNPAVFNRMAEEMLFLANVGVEVLRLDAVAFVWKRMGTACENLPEAHLLIQAFNAVARITTPSLLFKSEAIVHPDQLIQYVRADECQLSYNPLLMALLWNSLATRKTRLLNQALRTRLTLPAGCAWVNYVRSHDDIGWTFSNEDAALLGVKGWDHRQFLNSFYLGRFPGSFARGVIFQENPRTGDARISGTCASLAGLESALANQDLFQTELAIRRILLLHGIILTIGGIPLIYAGDEIGMLNDYSYQNDPTRAGDSRWVHRTHFDWQRAEQRKDPSTVAGKIYGGLQQLITLRKKYHAFGDGRLQVLDLDNVHVCGYVRQDSKERLVVLANFSEEPQRISSAALQRSQITGVHSDLLDGHPIDPDALVLEPYAFRCYCQRI